MSRVLLSPAVCNACFQPGWMLASAPCAQEVLQLIAQGLSNQEVADRLVISERTVAGHVRNILGKLHLASRTQAALYAIRTGLSHPNSV